MRLTRYLGLALAACLSFFSISAFAQPVAYAYRTVAVLAELPSVGVKRLELTLSIWRSNSQSAEESVASNLRASSNHFAMSWAKPALDGVGMTPC